MLGYMVQLTALPAHIPSPPIDSFHIGPLDIHFYALGYIIGITEAVGASLLSPGYQEAVIFICLLYTSPSPRDMRRSRMPSSA